MSISSKLDGTEARARTWFARVFNGLTVALLALRRKPRSAIAWPASRSIAIWAGAALLMLIAVMVLFDAGVATAARRSPAWVIAIFREITDFGKAGWFLYPLAALIVGFALLPPRLAHAARLVLAAIMVRAGFLFLAIAVPSLFVTIVKRLIGRGRPFVTGVADPFAYQPFVWRVEYAGMPSGHSTTAFAAAAAISILWPRARAVMLVYAFAIAISRMVLTAHYPSDVIAGAIVGTLGAVLVRNYFASRRLLFGVAPDGGVTLFPGPSGRRVKGAVRSILAD